jgi:hypothetical protein
MTLPVDFASACNAKVPNTIAANEWFVSRTSHFAARGVRGQGGDCLPKREVVRRNESCPLFDVQYLSSPHETVDENNAQLDGTVLLLTLKGDNKNLCGEGKLMTQGREECGALEQMAKAATTARVSSALPSPFAPKSMTFRNKGADAWDVVISNAWSAITGKSIVGRRCAKHLKSSLLVTAKMSIRNYVRLLPKVSGVPAER